jgi:hypothetical protein
MTHLNDKDYEQFKKISEKEGVTYESDFEMRQSADNLIGFFNILIEMDQAERSRKNRLESKPKGFSLAGEGRSRSLCGRGVYESDGWYDKWGFKCMDCQNAVDKKIIPGSMCGDYDHKKCITDSTLSYKTGLHIQAVRKLIRRGDITVRQIPNGLNMILRKDNPNMADVIERELDMKNQSSKD